MSLTMKEATLKTKPPGGKLPLKQKMEISSSKNWVPKAKSVIGKEKIERANEQNNKVKKVKVEKMEVDSEDENDSMLQMVFMGQV